MIYKITIEEVIEKEIPETEYKNTHQQSEDKKDIWDYVKTGKTEIDRSYREIYVQELKDLDLGELAIFINRVK